MTSTPTGVTVFSIRNASFRYARRLAVACESMDVQAGECVAFTGPNGSGKTTLLKLMNGLVGPFDGSIRFLGRPIGDNPLLRKRSIFLHQHPVLFAGSVLDNLLYPLKLRHVPQAEASSRVRDAAHRLDLENILDRPAARLSGGETQRVALARAVALGADVLLLDEPTSSMDEASQAAVRGIIAELKRSGATLIFSTHDAALALDVADRRFVFDANRIVSPDSTSATTIAHGGRS